MVKDYVDGEIALPVMRGPYLQSDVKMAAMLFRADLNRLTILCYNHLIAPGDRKTVYVPIMPNVLVVFADMLVSSLDERDKRMGKIPETEVSFWVLTMAMRRVGKIYLPNHLAWFIPYLFLDESSATATGREVYGFNKLMGQFPKKPEHIQQPEFSLDVLGQKTFDPEAVAKMERFIEMRRTDPKAEDAPTALWDSWDAAKSDLDDELKKNLKKAPKNRFIQLGTKLVNEKIPIVFLKQFRDAMDTKKASFQAVIEAPIKVKDFRKGGFLPGKHTLRVNHLDSHPLARALGLRLEDSEQKSGVGFWANVDFVIGKGK